MVADPRVRGVGSDGCRAWGIHAVRGETGRLAGQPSLRVEAVGGPVVAARADRVCAVAQVDGLLAVQRTQGVQRAPELGRRIAEEATATTWSATTGGMTLAKPNSGTAAEVMRSITAAPWE